MDDVTTTLPTSLSDHATLCSALSAAAKSAFTDALGLAVLIGAGFSLVGVLIVARLMPARGTDVSGDNDSSLRELAARPRNTVGECLGV